MWKFVVVEHKKKQSSIILIGENVADTKPCWNMLYDIGFDPADDVEMNLAFNGCLAWIENNKADGSKYLITEMFFCGDD